MTIFYRSWVSLGKNWSQRIYAGLILAALALAGAAYAQTSPPFDVLIVPPGTDVSRLPVAQCLAGARIDWSQRGQRINGAEVGSLILVLGMIDTRMNGVYRIAASASTVGAPNAIGNGVHAITAFCVVRP